MDISEKKFKKWVKEAIDSLPRDVLGHMHNVVIVVSNEPTKEQREKLKIGNHSILFGLYEGYHQAMKLNVGPVLPDKITIFKKAICGFYEKEEDIKKQIKSTIKHEIAHHFGSGETGARKAGQRNL
jgi:predicted Zn-dependent protease with MMP-like domain